MTTLPTLFAAVFMASLVGSLHCAGMCGGVVALCVSGRPVARARAWAPHVSYNLGRLVTYATLGAFSGAIGAAIDLGGASAGLSRVAAAIAGGAMILFGALALLQATGVRLGCVRLPARLQGVFRRGLRLANAAPPAARPLLVGLLTGFLPCGWLYAFVIAAAGTASPWVGATTMAIFWAGTVPVMLSLGLALHAVTTPLRRHVPTLTAAALVVVGVITVIGRLDVPAYASVAPARVPAPDTVVEHVHTLPDTGLPCCHDRP